MTTKPAADENETPIVAEVHEIRRRLLEQYGGVEGYLRHLREVDAEAPARA